MKSSLEKYGFTILATIVVIILVLMISSVGNVIKGSLFNKVEAFVDDAYISANVDALFRNGDEVNFNYEYSANYNHEIL